MRHFRYFLLFQNILFFYWIVSWWVFKEFALKNTCLFYLFTFCTVISLNWIFSSNKSFFDFIVDVSYHDRKFFNKLVFIFSSIFSMIGVIEEIRFQKIIMPLLTWTSVMTGIWKQIIRTKPNKIKLTNILIIKMITILKPNM